MAKAAEVLVAFSDPEKGRMLTSLLVPYGLQPVLCSTLAELRTLLARRPALVFCEDVLSDGNPADLLCEVKPPGSQVPVIMFSRQGDWKRYLEAMRCGTFDDIVAPYRSVGLCSTPGARPPPHHRNVAARPSRQSAGRKRWQRGAIFSAWADRARGETEVKR